jgi:hypothetical protein
MERPPTVHDAVREVRNGDEFLVNDNGYFVRAGLEGGTFDGQKAFEETWLYSDRYWACGLVFRGDWSCAGDEQDRK